MTRATSIRNKRNKREVKRNKGEKGNKSARPLRPPARIDSRAGRGKKAHREDLAPRRPAFHDAQRTRRLRHLTRSADCLPAERVLGRRPRATVDFQLVANETRPKRRNSERVQGQTKARAAVVRVTRAPADRSIKTKKQKRNG